jgi:hypothetical protein
MTMLRQLGAIPKEARCSHTASHQQIAKAIGGDLGGIAAKGTSNCKA